MSLEKATISWSAKQLKGMVINGKINFDHIVQRSYVWEKTRKTGLIESMILGYPVPPIYCKRVADDNKVYYVLDGKQRLSTVKEFLNDEFPLTEIEPVTYIDDTTNQEETVDISGKYFSGLPEGLKDYINTVSFTVTYFDNLSKEEEREMFKRLNAGKPLTAKSRALASAIDIENLLDIGKHEVFSDMLTDKALDNKNQVSIIMKSYLMLTKDVNIVSFDSKALNSELEKTTLTPDEADNLKKIFDLVYNIHDLLVGMEEKKVAKKIYTETHFVSLVPFFNKLVNSNVSEKLIAEWLIDFYGNGRNTSTSDEYNAACHSGINKNVNILNRYNALDESFDCFLSVDNSGQDEENEKDIESEADNERKTEKKNDNADNDPIDESILYSTENTSNMDDYNDFISSFTDSVIDDMSDSIGA